VCRPSAVISAPRYRDCERTTVNCGSVTYLLLLTLTALPPFSLFLSNFSHALVFCCCNFSFSKTYKQQFSNAVTFCHSHSNVVISAALVILCYLKTQDYCHTYIVIPVALSQTPGCVAIAVDGVPSFCLAVEGWPG